MKERIGIYLHIPFCLQKCFYCDFPSYSGILDRQDEYTAALCREITGFADGYFADTVYFGGGTPTLLRIENIQAVLEAVQKKFLLTDDCEITIECNPGTVDTEKLKALYCLGIHRLSIGMQATDDQVLKRLGRIHSAQDAIHCVESARKAGFQNISLDLMYGLPGQNVSDWADTLQNALKLRPEHFSCYALKVEEGTPFASIPIILPDDDMIRDMYDLTVGVLEQAGYLRYEISNFALKGFASRHNEKYWKCQDFVGFGAGAYSCFCGKRYANTADVSDYIQHSAGEKRVIYQEDLSQKDRMSEFMFLGLRTESGVDLSAFASRFGVRAEAVFEKPLKKYMSVGVIKKEKDHVFLRKDMFFVCNTILADFLL